MENHAKEVVYKVFTEVVPIKICITFLPVPKGDRNICVIYDTTKCYLHDDIWYSRLYIPATGPIIWSKDD